MIRHLKVFLVFIVLNTIIASIYLVWGVIRSSEKGQWKNYLFKAEVMLFCPGVGPMFFFVSNLIYKIFFRKAVDLADVIFSKERVTTFKRADIEAEGNLVPIEEALVVSDKGSQRALLLKVARGDIHNSLASISLALNSDDSETAHYAAAVLQDALNDFRLKVQELYEHMKEDEEDAPEYAALMIEYMNNMLSQSVFDELEQEKYIGMMEEAGELLYQKAREKLTAIYIECICLRLLQAMKYDRMEIWCGRSKELHPDILSTYTLQLKLYFTIQDKQRFFEVLNALKQSDIVIDRDTLALIRAFYESDGEKKSSEDKAERNSENKVESSSEDKTAEKTTAEPENTAGSAGTAAEVLTAAATAAVEQKPQSISQESTENTKKPAMGNISEKAEPVDTETLRNIFEEIEQEEAEEAPRVSKETKQEEAKALQSIFEEIEQEEAEAVKNNASKEIKPEEAAIPQKESKESDSTKTVVSSVIEDLIAENAQAEDINKQINQIIDELIIESEAREREAAALNQISPAHNRQISDEKKIDVLKTIAKKHKIWTCLGLGLAIAGVCLFIYLKNKKSKKE